MTLITGGSELDRVTVAFEAVRAYMEGEDSVLEAQREQYGTSYLEYGLFCLASGLIFTLPDPGAAIERLHELFPMEVVSTNNSIVRALELLHVNSNYDFQVNAAPIEVEHHETMVAVTVAVGGIIADRQEEPLQSLLDRVQLGLLEARSPFSDPDTPDNY